MSTKYYLQKVPAEAVEPGYSLAIRDEGKFRLFQVECAEITQRNNQPDLIRLVSTADNGAWVLEYEAGTPVVRLFGVCELAAS
ncbi:hypothetical protein [Mycobacterium asiaticum]|uniref:Uncharacterized protein n=1 Tax=Mycobacterium asiaticum TaxID=1790 RepID=A0A1A3N7M1_MYCAS|nr:hypothetical protein [Mycobacterium asiaticum]OBK16372.1 hypothetical protein A5636_03485 [Mycobacterium asiaticum]